MQLLLFLKLLNSAGCQWLTAIILATWEAEIRRIVVQNQHRQIVHETLSQKNPTQNRTGEVVQVIELLLANIIP
jgi:hypothetical protein